MNYITLMLLFITGSFMPDNSRKISVQKEFDIYIQVNFKNRNAVIFSYLDNNYRNATVKFVNNKQGDTILIKKITADKPTVFTRSEFINTRSISQQFIGFNNGDTIMFESNNSGLSYIGKDKRNYIVNQIFGKIDIGLMDRKISIHEFADQQTAIENERSKQVKALTNLISIYPIDTCSIKTITTLIDLYYYDKLFNINFSGEKTKNWKNPYFNKFDRLDKKTKILSSISSRHTISILYETNQLWCIFE